MAISEKVRLVIEVPGGQDAQRILRALARDSRLLRGAFVQAQRGATSLGSQVSRGANQAKTAMDGASSSGQRMRDNIVPKQEETRRTVKSFQQIREEAAKLSKQYNNLTTQQQRQSEINKRASLLLVDFGRGVQDLEYGLRAVINNIDPLILNTKRYTDAIRESAGGTLTMTAAAKGLFAVLRSPAGLLAIINLLFVLSSVTGVFDKLGAGAKRFFATLTGGNPRLKELRDTIKELQEGEGLVVDTQYIDEAEAKIKSLRAELNDLYLEQNLARQLFQRSPLEILVRYFEQDRGQIKSSIEGIEGAVEDLRANIEQEVTRLNVVLEQLASPERRRANEIAQQIRDAASAEARALADASKENIEAQRQAIRAELAAELETLRQAAEERTLEYLATGDKSAQAAARAIGIQAEAIRAAATAAEQELERDFAEAARERLRVVLDIERSFQRERALVGLEGAEEQVQIIRNETAARIDAYRRDAEDFEGTERERERFARATTGLIVLAEQEAADKIREIRQKQLQDEIDAQERRLRLEEDLLRARRERDEEDILRDRIQRIDEEIAKTEAGEERKKELAEERISLEIQLAETISRRLETEAREQEQAAERIARLNEQLANLRDRLREAQGVPLSGIFDERLAALREQLASAQEGSEEYLELQREILRVQVDIAQQERDILEERTRNIERFVDKIASAAIEVASQRSRFSPLDIEAQEADFDRAERQLKQSLQERKISQEEFNREMRLLARDRADFEKEVERDRAGLLRRLAKETTSVILDELRKRAARFVASKIAELTITRTTEAQKTGAEAAGAAARNLISLSEIGSALKTAGANMIAAVAKFIKNIPLPFPLNIAAAAGVPFALYGIFRGARSLFGFEKGGYTGQGRKDEEAGVVHRGEFVMTKRAVQGNPAPFYALMRALESGRLTPDSLTRLLASSGIRANPVAMMAATGLYQEGGFVQAQSSLATSRQIVGSEAQGTLEDIRRENQLLRAAVLQLGRNIEELAARPQQLNVSGRSSRRIQQAGTDYARTVKPKS